jgi:hypothetical protein
VSSILRATGKLKQTATSFPATERKSSLHDCQMEQLNNMPLTAKNSIFSNLKDDST